MDNEWKNFTFETILEGDLLRCIIQPTEWVEYACFVICNEEIIYRDVAYSDDLVREWNLKDLICNYCGLVNVYIRVFAKKGNDKRFCDGKTVDYDAKHKVLNSKDWRDFVFSTDIQGDLLRCIIYPTERVEYACYVICNEEIVYRDKAYSDVLVREWNLKDLICNNCRYVKLCIKVFAKKESEKRYKTGTKVYYKVKALKNDFPQKLDFYHREKPFGDFCLVYGNEFGMLTELAEEEKLNSYDFNIKDCNGVCCKIISSEQIKKTPTCQVFFSGMSRFDDKFILGQKDAQLLPDPTVLKDTVGNFVMVYENDNEINICSDYFGVAKVFYYKEDNLWIISNRYQLLLMVMQKMYLTITPYKTKWLADLFGIDQLNQQIFSRNMEVDNTYLLPIDQSIKITKNGISVVPKEIYKVLNNPGVFNNDNYSQLLQQGAEEIKDNIKAVYKHPEIKRVSIDVTGGLDSRVVLNAWTDLSGHDKMKPTGMFTDKTPGHPEDAAIGLELGRKAGLPFKGWPTKKTFLNIEQYYLKTVSCYFGEWFLYDAPNTMQKVEGLINLYGGFGEICCRIYYSRRHFYDFGEYKSIAEMTKWLAKNGLDTYRIKLEVLMDAWKQEMKQEFLLIPGRSPSEKRDLHYLFYRNGLHLKREMFPDISNICWGPIQSKAMFLLKMQSFYTFPELKLQIDLLELLNPDLADFKFEYEKDNIAREKIHKDSLALRTGFSFNDKIMDESSVDQAYKEYFNQVESLTEVTNSSKERQELEAKNYNFGDKYRKWFIYALEKVLDVIEGDIGKEGRYEINKWVEAKILGEKALSEKDYYINKIIYMGFLTQYLDK